MNRRFLSVLGLPFGIGGAAALGAARPQQQVVEALGVAVIAQINWPGH
jgi:hypothetical protein